MCEIAGCILCALSYGNNVLRGLLSTTNLKRVWPCISGEWRESSGSLHALKQADVNEGVKFGAKHVTDISLKPQ